MLDWYPGRNPFYFTAHSLVLSEEADKVYGYGKTLANARPVPDKRFGSRRIAMFLEVHVGGSLVCFIHFSGVVSHFTFLHACCTPRLPEVRQYGKAACRAKLWKEFADVSQCYTTSYCRAHYDVWSWGCPGMAAMAVVVGLEKVNLFPAVSNWHLNIPFIGPSLRVREYPTEL